MGQEATGRVALMSIHPRYANAILDGHKTVEFRKRPLADDVTHVVIYSTVPEKAVIGFFSIESQETRTPVTLWEEFHDQGVIEREAFFAYYAGSERGTGIRVRRAVRLRRKISLTQDLGVARPPQCFQYLDDASFQKVVASAD